MPWAFKLSFTPLLLSSPVSDPIHEPFPHTATDALYVTSHPTGTEDEAVNKAAVVPSHMDLSSEHKEP